MCELDDVVSRYRTSPLLILGDFNARSYRWDVVDNVKEDALVDWADSVGLILLNREITPTYVRPQGLSVVDVSWANPAAARDVKGWQVNPTIEILARPCGDCDRARDRIGNKTRNVLQKHFLRWEALRCELVSDGAGKCADVSPPLEGD